MLTCRWCGCTGTEDDFDLAPDNAGFWCNDCDGFSHYDQLDAQRHRMLLLLENAACENPVLHIRSSVPKLRKHLSPLRYPGGKSKVIDYLYAQLQDDKLDTFVEVFAGGASLGLSLLDAGVIQGLILNDIDPGVYSLWKTVLERPEILLERLSAPPPTANTYWQQKSVLRAASAPTEDLAWAQLVANRLSFSGIVMANPMGGKHGTQEQLLCRWNPKELARRITWISQMADRIEVTNLDCEALIEEKYWPERTTLFVDPPYFCKADKLYPHAFAEEQHRSLSFLLNNLYLGMPGADIIITYDDHPEIRELYPFADQQILPRKYSIARNPARTNSEHQAC